MTSDAAEYHEQHRFLVIDQSVKHLRAMQGALHRIFAAVVSGSQWSEFNAQGLKAYADKNDWDMIVNNPDDLGRPIIARQKADVERTAQLLGETLLKHTGHTLMDTPPETLRENPAQLGKVEMTLEEISEFLTPGKADAPVIVLKEGVKDMINNNAGLSAHAARAFNFKPVAVDEDEKRLDGKRQLLDVAQVWAELAMLETRVMRTALLMDMAYEKKGVTQSRTHADYQGRIIMSTPTQAQFVISDKQAFTGLGRAKQSLHQALTHY